MKKIFTGLAILTFSIFYTQIKAITEDGYDVILLRDGTWRYKNASDADKNETAKTNTTLYTANPNASFLVSSKRMNIGVKYNPKEWNLVNRPSPSPLIEFLFISQDGGNYATVSTELTPSIPLATLKDVITSGLQASTSYIRFKEAEYRTVNGQKVLYLQYAANVKGMDFEYAGYYYSGESGTAQFVTYTSASLFEQRKDTLINFLNGLVPAEKSTLMSPPPPMEVKKSK